MPPLDAPPSGAASVILGPGWGWSRHRLPSGAVSIKGYVLDGARTLEGESAGRHVADALAGAHDDAGLTRALRGLAGHFAFVLEQSHRVVASVDRIRAIPLTYAATDDRLLIDDRATRLRDRLGLGPGDLDREQVLAAAMSGYTTGGATLYHGLCDLPAGHAVVADASGWRLLRWFLYDAWNTCSITNPERRLGELHRFLIERLAQGAAGRAICVPLSAGYDSRFIAAGLKEMGLRDVRLFSYGRPGNHEALAAQAIAEKLGYPWTFVPFTTRSQQQMYADPSHEEALWRTGDAATSVPFEQDWRAIAELRRSGYIPAHSIIVNGQSGDFITGNHAPAGLVRVPAGLSAEERGQRLARTMVAKHYRLWRALATPSNDARIASLLLGQADHAGADLGTGELAGVHEMLEYVNRQAKYVVSGQRTYEAQGLAWRLPLWDDEYVEFWKNAPFDLKAGQSLYRRVLEADNWAGAFSGVPINRKTITPAWIRPLRLAAKLACAPLGAKRWHETERRVFGWWMDPLRTSAVVPYSRALADRRGARHAVAWLAERWLERHGASLPATDGRSS